MKEVGEEEGTAYAKGWKHSITGTQVWRGANCGGTQRTANDSVQQFSVAGPEGTNGKGLREDEKAERGQSRKGFLTMLRHWNLKGCYGEPLRDFEWWSHKINWRILTSLFWGLGDWGHWRPKIREKAVRSPIHIYRGERRPDLKQQQLEWRGGSIF